MDEVVELPDGRRAQVWLGGATRGPLVVFAHGCPDTRHAAMTGHEAAVGAGLRLLAVNRPGYGRSDPDETSQSSVADDLVAVADLLGVERFGLLGMSVGGSYAVTCAARHPDRVAVLGLVATQWRTSAGEDTVAEAVESARPEFERWVEGVAPDDPDDNALAARWRGGLPAPDAALLAEVSDHEVAASVREALGNHEGYLRDAALVFRPWDHAPEEVAAPTYLWLGELDESAPPADGMDLGARIPGASVTVRPATTHLATLLAHWPDTLRTLRPHLD